METAVEVWHPYRVILPPLAYIEPEPVRGALVAFLRLYAEWQKAGQVITDLSRVAADAIGIDRAAVADAIERGVREPKPRAETNKAESALADARARMQAVEAALASVHAKLVAATVEHAPAWAGAVAVEHRAAVERYEELAAELAAAGRHVEATGSLLAMLTLAPASMNVRHAYRPSFHLAQAADAAAEAVVKVRDAVPSTELAVA